ncbi:MAG: hypothetical protein H6545_05935 [Bacteroidales bacterium]|nr:hypothetical protein [Bacteroidales bacterium]
MTFRQFVAEKAESSRATTVKELKEKPDSTPPTGFEALEWLGLFSDTDMDMPLPLRTRSLLT